jgi:hypothetical protein
MNRRVNAIAGSLASPEASAVDAGIRHTLRDELGCGDGAAKEHAPRVDLP